MWDNRSKKASGQYKSNRADYSCKDKDGCNKGVWLKDSESAPASNGNGHRAPTVTRTNAAGRPLGPLYAECLKFAKEACKYHFGDTAAPSDVIAAAATLFIQAVKDGGVIRAVKPIPPPPPPPPPPVQDAYEYQSSDHDLPF